MFSKKIFVYVFFCMLLLLRIFLVPPVDGFSNDTSYQIVRHIEHIHQTNTPLFHDSLSFNGRDVLFNPIVYYALSIITPAENVVNWLQIYAQFLWLLLAILLFAITKQLIKNELYAYISVLLFTLMPIQFFFTLNTIQIVVLFLALVLFQMYLYLLWRKRKQPLYFWMFTVITTVLAIFHPMGLLSVIAFLIYQLLRKIDGRNIEKKEIELVFFLTLFGLLINYILYYQAFLLHRSTIFFQYVLSYFDQFTIISVLPQLGLIVLALALYGFYQAYANQLVQKGFLLFVLSYVLVICVVSILGIIPLVQGFFLLFAFSTLFASFFIYQTTQNIKATKFFKFHTFFRFILITFLCVSLAIASVIYVPQILDSTPSQPFKEALFSINTFSENQTNVILVPPQFSIRTMYYSSQATLVDSNALLQLDSQSRLDFIQRVYTSYFYSQVRPQLQQFMLPHQRVFIIISDEFQELYRTTSEFLSSDCIQLVFENTNYSVYELGCLDES